SAYPLPALCHGRDVDWPGWWAERALLVEPRGLLRLREPDGAVRDRTRSHLHQFYPTVGAPVLEGTPLALGTALAERARADQLGAARRQRQRLVSPTRVTN